MENGLLILSFLIGLGVGYLWGHAAKAQQRNLQGSLRVTGKSVAPAKKTRKKRR